MSPSNNLSKEERQQLILEAERWCHKFTHQFLANYMVFNLEDIEDAHACAVQGLCAAAVTFDPSRQLQFKTYSTWWIRKELFRWFQLTYPKGYRRSRARRKGKEEQTPQIQNEHREMQLAYLIQTQDNQEIVDHRLDQISMFSYLEPKERFLLKKVYEEDALFKDLAKDFKVGARTVRKYHKKIIQKLQTLFVEDTI